MKAIVLGKARRDGQLGSNDFDSFLTSEVHWKFARLPGHLYWKYVPMIFNMHILDKNNPRDARNVTKSSDLDQKLHILMKKVTKTQEHKETSMPCFYPKSQQTSN